NASVFEPQVMMGISMLQPLLRFQNRGRPRSSLSSRNASSKPSTLNPIMSVSSKQEHYFPRWRSSGLRKRGHLHLDTTRQCASDSKTDTKSYSGRRAGRGHFREKNLGNFSVPTYSALAPSM